MFNFLPVSIRSDREVSQQIADAFRLPSLDALAFTAGGLATFLIGSWAPDVRLTLAGMPFNTLLLCAMLLFALEGTISKRTLIDVSIVQIPLFLLGITLFWSTNAQYGLDKFTSLVISGNIAFVLFNTVVERHGADELIRILFGYLLLLLALTIAYKLAFGFFNRNVRFFMNGPIVFGRLMSVAVVIAVYRYAGRWRLILTTLLLLSIIWTESKGPILAAVGSIIVAIYYFSPPRKRLLLIVLVCMLAASAIYASKNLFESYELGRLGAVVDLASGDFDKIESGRNAGSLGLRVKIWGQAIGYIHEHPLGVGLGGWERLLDQVYGAEYPHNMFFELWVEGGVFLGSFASLPLILFMFFRKNIFSFVALCLFLCQLVSGDLGDARMLLVFSLLACFSRVTSQTVRQHPSTLPVH